MKIKSLALSIAAAVILPVVGLTGPVFADSPGQIDSGTIYRVKNVTKNTAYAGTASAGACEQVKFRVLLHNSRFGSVDNVVVSATLPSGGGVSSMTTTYESPGPEHSVSADATLNLTAPAQTVTYEAGSSQLIDENGNLIQSLPDGIVGGGVNIGTINGSTSELVTFTAKTNCPTPPNCQTTPSLCPPPVTPPTPPATTTPGTPTTLVNTGPGETAALFVAAMLAGTFGYRKYLSRRLSRQ